MKEFGFILWNTFTVGVHVLFAAVAIRKVIHIEEYLE